MTARTALLLCCLALTCGLAAAAELPDDAVFRAMKAELERASGSLRLEGYPPPYVVSAQVNSYTTAGVRAEFGALTGSGESRDRSVSVNVRVGDRKLDSSRLVRLRPSFRFHRPDVTLEQDEHELRRALWLALDSAYKQAVEDLSRKQAVLDGQTRDDSDELPQYSEEKPLVRAIPAGDTDLDRPSWEGRVRRLSGVFREFPEIQSSQARASWTHRTIHCMDNEGTRVFFPRTLLVVEVVARTQAPDGMPLDDFVSFYYRTASEADDEETMLVAVREMAERLTSRRGAPTVEKSYLGPVLLEGQAAAELLLALAGHSAAVTREPVYEDARISSFMSMSAPPSPWKDRLGTRVAARLLDVRDDPTRASYGGVGLIGSYAIDDQGVAAQPVTLVRRGILKAVLGSRTPVKGAEHSNGHARGLASLSPFMPGGGIAPAPGVLMVTAANDAPVTPEAVRAEFLELLEELGLDHGLVVRRIQNAAANPRSRDDMFELMSSRRSARPGEDGPVARPLEVIKVALDGSETLVRGLGWGRLDARVLRDVVAASSGDGGEAAWNLRSAPGTGMARFGALPTSVIAPRAILFEELELEPLKGPFPQQPALPHPSFAERKESG